jgi:hypothetical protein
LLPRSTCSSAATIFLRLACLGNLENACASSPDSPEQSSHRPVRSSFLKNEAQRFAVEHIAALI